MKPRRVLVQGLLAGLTIGLLAGCSAPSQQQTRSPAASAQGLPAFTDLVQQAAPSVVTVTVSPGGGSQYRIDPPTWNFRNGSLRELLKRFFGTGEQQEPVLPKLAQRRVSWTTGSGFIISEDGYIITSRRLVHGADRVMVHLNNRRHMTAKVVGSDKYSGIALLKVEADNLNPVDIGSADALKRGAWVLAIGAPPGVQTSVTAGIVSAKGRHLAGKQYIPFIQTDAAITPTAAGGPLLNMQGKVVGVNAPTFGRIPGSQGLSFAIPIGIAMDVATELMEDGTVERGWLGVQIQEVTPALAESFGMKWPHGALIAHIVPGTPAAASALQAGDVIVKYDGVPIPHVSALPPLVGRTDPGETVEIVVVRDGDKETVEVEIGKLNQSLWSRMWSGDTGDNAASGAALGVRMRALTDSERRQLGIPKGGVRIVEIAPGLARRAGLQAGDVIAAVGSEPVTSPQALRERLTEADEPVALRVLRNGDVRYIAFEPNP